MVRRVPPDQYRLVAVSELSTPGIFHTRDSIEGQRNPAGFECDYTGHKGRCDNSLPKFEVPMLVADFMTRRVITITPDSSLAEAVRLLAFHNIRRIIVLRNRSVIGILTDGDVLRACPADLNPFSAVAAEDLALRRTVGRCMTSPVETIQSDTPLEQAAAMFLEKKIGALPVMSGDSLVGIITESDTLRALIALLGSGSGIRITFNVPDEDEDVFAFVLELSNRHKMQVAALLSHEQAGHRVVLVRLLGTESPMLLEEIWSSGHRVISVARL